MSRRTPLFAMVASLMLMMSMGPISSAQIGILPSVEITCDDPGPVEVWPGATRTTIVYCTLENPSIHSESVEIGTESEESDFEFAAPQTVTIGAGQEMDIQIIIRVPELFAAGTYSANVTAKVTEANGIDVTAITSTEEDSVSFEVMKYGSCEVMVGQGGGAIEAGDPVVFAASFICEANAEFSIGYSLVMIDEVAMSSIWPSGFEDQSAPCQFQVLATGGGGNCQFQIATPSNLANSWSGCVILIDDDGDGDGFGSSPPSSCNTNYPSLGVDIEPQGLSLVSIGLDSNSSVSELLMDNKELVGGGVGGLVLLLSLILILRRRSRSYDEEWEED